MKYLQDIRAAHADPERLENLYRAALRENAGDECKSDLLACHAESPDNILYAAWRYRLQAETEQPEGRGVNWKLAIPLGLIAGLVFAVLSSSRLDLPRHTPLVLFAWAPIGACFIVAFLTLQATPRQYPQRAWAVIAGLIAISIYVVLIVALANRQQYEVLMALHLPLLALTGVGITLVGIKSNAQERFAFLLKAIEVGVTGGVYVIVGGMFAGITIGLFSALSVQLPVELIRMLIAAGAGVICVLAVATVYDPRVAPLAQRFEQGLGKLVPTMMRLLLPLTLIVLVVYLFVIPFNFMQPFRNRDILIVYNAMLFAVMGLLIGATPLQEHDLPQYHGALRAGILAVASLTVVISLYALSATVYRTAMGGFTLNRVTVIGWNVINIGILVLLIYKQVKHGAATWVSSLHSAISAGTIAYVVWALFLTLISPWLFR
jgi:hypothetical protein